MLGLTVVDLCVCVCVCVCARVHERSVTSMLEVAIREFRFCYNDMYVNLEQDAQ